MEDSDLESECSGSNVCTDQNVKKKPKRGRMTDVMKQLRLSTHETGPDCKCKRLKCFESTSDKERKLIIKHFNEFKTYDEQNLYLFGLITACPIKARRSRKEDDADAQYHDNSYRYKVIITRNNSAIEVPVCVKAFVAIHGITLRRVQTLQTSLKKTGQSPKDQRGKYVHSHCTKSSEVMRCIIDHIKSFKGRSSHYSKKKSNRVYLPESLNIKQMFQLYKEKGLSEVSYEFYRKVFNTKFNIKFGYPRSDTCSSCDKFQADKKALDVELSNKSLSADERRVIEEKLKKLIVDNDVHKIKAETFYKRKKIARKVSSTRKDYEAVTMNYQKNLSLPNLSTNDVYYRRQLSFYSFNIHILSTGESYFYCYTEEVANKGSNEVCSMIHHFIFNILKPEVQHLEIFCDSCSGQNKNYTLIRLMNYIVTDTQRLKSIKVTFPVRGHSYLECDRNMAIIKQKSPAELPQDWITVFETARVKPCPFAVIEVDQSLIRNWEGYLNPMFHKMCTFKTRPVRELLFESTYRRLVKHRSTFNGAWETSKLRLQGAKTTPTNNPGEWFLPPKLYTGPQMRSEVAAAPILQEEKITFHVYSADSDNSTSEATGRSSQLSQDILPNYPLTLIIHGFTGSYMAKSMRMIRDGLLYRGLKNVVLVDWESLARIPNISVTVSYYQIVEDNVPLVADEITSWLRNLYDKNLIDYSEVHIIGFSLGAQIAGIVGAQLAGEIGRITALDPPKIGYAEKSLENRLDASDAQFVSVTHTSGGFISFAEPIGHVDFYPNGGLPPQPQCPTDDMIHSMACSHYMAYKVFTESIYNDAAFNATKCDDWKSFLDGKCDNNEHALMGYPTLNTTEGSFFIKTNSMPPFGSASEESPIPPHILELMSYSEEDRLQITSSFTDPEEGDDRDKYDTTDSSEDRIDTGITETPSDIPADTPGHSIMKVKSKHHDDQTTTVRPYKDRSNSSSRNFHSHILIFFSCAFSLRYFRL